MARLTQGSFRDTRRVLGAERTLDRLPPPLHGRCTIAVLDTASSKARTLVRSTVDLGLRRPADLVDWTARRILLREPRRPLVGPEPRRTCEKADADIASASGARASAPDGRSLGFVDGGGAWLLHPQRSAHAARAGAHRLLVVARRAIDRLPPLGRWERGDRPVRPRSGAADATEALRSGRGRTELVARRREARLLVRHGATGRRRCSQSPTSPATPPTSSTTRRSPTGDSSGQ